MHSDSSMRNLIDTKRARMRELKEVNSVPLDHLRRLRSTGTKRSVYADRSAGLTSSSTISPMANLLISLL